MLISDEWKWNLESSYYTSSHKNPDEDPQQKDKMGLYKLKNTLFSPSRKLVL